MDRPKSILLHPENINSISVDNLFEVIPMSNVIQNITTWKIYFNRLPSVRIKLDYGFVRYIFSMRIIRHMKNEHEGKKDSMGLPFTNHDLANKE